MSVINVFVSRPISLIGVHEHRLKAFYSLIEEQGFKAHTTGVNRAPLESPFSDVHDLMNKCQCSIILGLPQINLATDSIKNLIIKKPTKLPSEWNQIEGTMSLMLKMPTLMLLHRGVEARGLFARGAANVFIHEFFLMDKDWQLGLVPALKALRETCSSGDA